MRLTWLLPEDLVAHELVQAAAEGVDVTEPRAHWVAAGGSTVPAAGGASDDPTAARLRPLARELLGQLDGLTARHPPSPDEPDTLAEIEAGWPPAPAAVVPADAVDRVHGGWLGRAAGCLLGKPVEKIPREGIEAIAMATGNWPVRGYFTARGLPDAVAGRWPWNRRSAATSLVENIAGMPEDDDLNFAMLALSLVERHGSALSTADVAAAWLADLPAGRVFTAERIAYRNLLDAVPVERAAVVGNPFREWIGAQIRTDVYGWVRPGDPIAAARLANADARLSHRRNGIYGGMFVAAMCAAAVVSADVDEVVATGLAVVPPRSRLADAISFGVQLGHSGRSTKDDLDELHRAYGHLHWVHVLNNAALVAYALTASRGDFATAVSLAVTGGWDTDSAGATVGSVCGALHGASALPRSWIDPLRNRIASSLPGFDGIGFDELARRTVAAAR